MRDGVALAIGWALALAALGFLHGAFEPLWAFACAWIAAGFRRGLQASWSLLPSFLHPWLDAGATALGALLATLATLGTYGPATVVLRWREAVALGLGAGGVGLAVAVLVYTHRRVAAEVEAHEARLAAMRRRALEARLSTLQARIHPHFLFNTLNTLAEVVHEDADLAEDLITDLAGMMRDTLRSSTGPIPLQREIELVQRYLRIERARLGGRLRDDVRCDPAAEAVHVPGLLIQPLVENAVQHAAARSPEGGRVSVAVSREGDRVRIVVEDDGPGLPTDVRARLDRSDRPRGAGTGGAGGGLANVRERLELAYPAGRGSFVWADLPDGGTRITLEVPV